MINAATILREHRALMADVDRAIADRAARGCQVDPVFMRDGKRLHGRLVRLLRMLDQIDESKLKDSIASQLDAIRRHKPVWLREIQRPRYGALRHRQG